MQIIDSHVHFWKYVKTRNSKTVQDNKLLKQDYLPETLALNLQRNGVSGCIAVESEAAEVETRFLSELAGTHPIIAGVIGWIDISAPDIEEKLEHFSGYPSIKGYRYDLEGNASLREQARGISALKKYNYTFDLIGSAFNQKQILDLVHEVPDQPYILDHCGSPDIKKPVSEEWRNMIKEISQSPNVSCKLSGLLTLANWKSWSPAQFYPFLDMVFEHFGTDRLLFGSDWPFMLLSGAYVQWKSMVEKYMESYVPEAKEMVFGLNATRIYHL